MGWLDDLQTRAQQSIDNAKKDIYGFIGGIASTPVVKQGPQPTGNLTAAQLAAGQRGGTPAVAVPASNPNILASMQGYAPILIAAAAAYFFLKGRK